MATDLAKFEIENVVGSGEFRSKMSFYLEQATTTPVMIHRGNPETTVVIISRELYLKLIENGKRK